MRYLIKSTARENFLRIHVQEKDNSVDVPMPTEPRITYGDFAIRIDDRIKQPKNRKELQALVFELMELGCDAYIRKKNLEDSLVEALRKSLESPKVETVTFKRNPATETQIWPKEMDAYDPDAPEYPIEVPPDYPSQVPQL